MPIPTTRGRRARLAAATGLVGALLVAAPVAACELDGLSHGYGPMSALFAGAHRYSSLNGVEEEARDDAPQPPPAAPPTPRRSFVAWARVKPKAGGTPETPGASWMRGTARPKTAPASPSPDASSPRAAPGAPPATPPRPPAGRR